MAIYGSLADANTYHSTYDLTGLWAGYSDAQKTAALNRATLLIDRLQFVGERYDEDQELSFPRMFDDGIKAIIIDTDRSSGAVIVPKDVEYATYEQAKFLLDTKDDEVIQKILNGVTSISVSATSESYDASKLPVSVETRLATEVYRMLKKFLIHGW